MTRRWWAPGARDAGRAGARRPADVLRLLQPALDRQPALGHRAPARGRDHGLGRSAEDPDDLRPSSTAFRDGRSRRLVGELPLLLGARLLRGAAARIEASSSAREEERAVGVTHISSRTALRVSAQVIALDSLDPPRLDPRLGDVDADTLARNPAVIVNIEYPLGLAAYNILREITEAHDTPARRLRARQGGDAQRRRRRRDDLVGHPRRALGLDLLARQRVLGRRHRALPDVRLRARQPARGHGQVDVPAEPRVPRLLLPRGVHGGGDGGRARSATRSTRSPTSIATRSARRSTSPSSRSTSGSSTTPPTRPTRRRARSARAGCRYYGMDSTYASSLAILRRVLARGRCGAPRPA